MLNILAACVLTGNRISLHNCGLNISITDQCVVRNAESGQNLSLPFRHFGQTILLCNAVMFYTATEYKACLASAYHSKLEIVTDKRAYAFKFDEGAYKSAAFVYLNEKIAVYVAPLRNMNEIIMQLTCHAANATQVFLLEKYEQLTSERMELLFGCNYFNAHVNDTIDDIAQEARDRAAEFYYNLARYCNEHMNAFVYCDLSAKRLQNGKAAHEFDIFGIVSENSE